MTKGSSPAEPKTKPLSGAEFARLMSGCGGFGGHVAVAVSGGADSMALALLAQIWGQDLGISVTALTVDHDLREGSAAEAAQVATWLGAKALDHHILTWQHDGAVTSAVQARARDARYALMGDWCRAHGAAHLLCAHHQDDQAETVLMRLKKGTTLFGLAAMQPTRDLDGTVLCRPLLTVPKARLRATLKTNQQDWVEDPSNQNQAFERVRVRSQMAGLAAQGVSAKRLAGAARGARAVRDILDAAADSLIAAHTELRGTGVALTGPFWDAPDVVCGRALAMVLTRIGGSAYAPSPAKLDRLYAWMVQGGHKRGQKGDQVSGARTLGGCWVRRLGTEFLISSEPPRKNAAEA